MIGVVRYFVTRILSLLSKTKTVPLQKVNVVVRRGGRRRGTRPESSDWTSLLGGVDQDYPGQVTPRDRPLISLPLLKHSHGPGTDEGNHRRNPVDTGSWRQYRRHPLGGVHQEREGVLRSPDPHPVGGGEGSYVWVWVWWSRSYGVKEDSKGTWVGSGNIYNEIIWGLIFLFEVWTHTRTVL